MTHSPHAARRMAQRAVSQHQVELALAWGRRIHQSGGREAFHIGRKEVRRAATFGIDLREAEGVAIVVAADGVVVTVLRSIDRRRLVRWSRAA
jgi:murein DD-endopeptidase MepM/ murein hydrolase activator NlpD